MKALPSLQQTFQVRKGTPCKHKFVNLASEEYNTRMAKTKPIRLASLAQGKSVLAREDDGTIQLTLTIPQDEIKKREQEVLVELAKNIEVPGFRRGNAPLDQVKASVSAQTILEKILSRILPGAFAKAIEEHRIHPILTPRFELINAPLRQGSEGQAREGDLQVRAVTCEAPLVELGDYKQSLKSLRSDFKKEIESAKPIIKTKDEKPQTPADKENLVIDTLLKTTQVNIPKPLIEEEVNHRLSDLVEQTQKLGLTVEQYLNSTGKSAEGIRAEYAKQAEDQIKIMLLLSHIADAEGIQITDADVEKTASDTSQKNLTNAQKEVIRAVLRRRGALDKLVSIL